MKKAHNARTAIAIARVYLSAAISNAMESTTPNAPGVAVRLENIQRQLEELARVVDMPSTIGDLEAER